MSELGSRGTQAQIKEEQMKKIRKEKGKGGQE